MYLSFALQYLGCNESIPSPSFIYVELYRMELQHRHVITVNAHLSHLNIHCSGIIKFEMVWPPPQENKYAFLLFTLQFNNSSIFLGLFQVH